MPEQFGDRMIKSRVEPSYPKGDCAKGDVLVRILVTESGSVKKVTIVRGDAALSNAVITAVKRWRYEEYLINGKPVEYETETTLRVPETCSK